MKRFLALTFALWTALFVIPLLSVRPWDKPESTEVTPAPASVETQASAPAPSITQKNIDASTNITLLHEGKVISLPLDEYLAGVVVAEMPVVFPEEAIKAQVVAARTHTMNRASLKPSTEHKGAMVCSNPGHCKAYKPLSIAAANWGVSREAYTEKIMRAIRETDGEILLYNNQPISAVFFAISSGKTERAADVWGQDVPYLQSVESPGEDEVDGYLGKVEVSASDFQKKVTSKYKNAKFDSDPHVWFTDITRSDAGGVMKCTVGGVILKGSAVRTLFGLRSTNFTVTCTKDMVTFETRGYGHGVGLSQYGSRTLANQGKNYKEILAWYYRGVSFGKISK